MIFRLVEQASPTIQDNVGFNAAGNDGYAATIGLQNYMRKP